MARVTMSTLPVRSPLPNSVPSTRSAPGQDGELGGGHRRAPVVVRVEAEDDGVAVGDVPAEPLDDVGVDVGPVHLDGVGQVDDDRPLRRGLDHPHHRFADLDGEVGLGAGEALGRVLVADLGVGQCRLELPAQAGGVDGDVDDAGPVEAEHHPALELGRRVVEVDDGPGGALQRFEGAFDQLLAALDQHLDGHVVGDEVVLDDLALEVESVWEAEGKPTSISLKPMSIRVRNRAACARGPWGR